MRNFIIRRIFQSFIVLNVVLFFVFSMLQISGDPATVLMPEDASQEAIAEFRAEMGFDQPLHIQYVNFLFGHGKNRGVLRADFGHSYHHQVPALE